MSKNLLPDPLFALQIGFFASRAFATAVQLGIFSALAEGNHTVQSIAHRIHCAERGTRMLLNALTALELLHKRDETFELSPLAATYLDPSKEDYVGAVLESDRSWQSWMELPAAVRTGRPQLSGGRDENPAAYFYPLIQSLHVYHRAPAARAALALGVSHAPPGFRVLDLACGSAVWSLAIADAAPTAQVTAHDFEDILVHTEVYVSRAGHLGRYTFLPGNIREMPLPKESFDLILLGHLLHSEGAERSQNLLARCVESLRPHGRIAIFEMLPNDLRTAPPFALLFSLQMLLQTEDGDTLTLKELTAWLTKGGCSHVQTFDIGSHSPVVVGYKR